jgi:hypothetical protein
MDTCVIYLETIQYILYTWYEIQKFWQALTTSAFLKILQSIILQLG